VRPKRSRRRLSDRRSADHQRSTLIEFDVTFLLMSGRGSMSYGLGLDRDSGVQSPILASPACS
jgi:hypothetical protein